jgi:hypothetical protein
MRRILSALSVAAVMAAIVAATATSAFATPIPEEGAGSVANAQAHGAPLEVGQSCSIFACIFIASNRLYRRSLRALLRGDQRRGWARKTPAPYLFSPRDEISPAIHNKTSKHKARLRKRLRGVPVSENAYNRQPSFREDPF